VSKGTRNKTCQSTLPGRCNRANSPPRLVLSARPPAAGVPSPVHHWHRTQWHAALHPPPLNMVPPSLLTTWKAFSVDCFLSPPPVSQSAVSINTSPVPTLGHSIEITVKQEVHFFLSRHSVQGLLIDWAGFYVSTNTVLVIWETVLQIQGLQWVASSIEKFELLTVDCYRQEVLV